MLLRVSPELYGCINLRVVGAWRERLRDEIGELADKSISPSSSRSSSTLRMRIIEVSRDRAVERRALFPYDSLAFGAEIPASQDKDVRITGTIVRLCSPFPDEHHHECYHGLWEITLYEPNEHMSEFGYDAYHVSE